MTEQELREYQLEVRVAILEMALKIALVDLQRFSQRSVESYKETLSESLAGAADIKFPISDPAMYDLTKSEFQEAFDSVIALVDSTV